MISINNLTKYYDENCALDGLDITINQGEILGLLGPNGAGKTTTMRILTCFLKPTSGTIEVKGLDVTEDPIEVKKLIGYLPENAPLYPDMLAYEYLKYVAAIRRIPPADRLGRIEELASLCGLEEVMHMAIKELSKGYKQRVGLAHAMMSDPEILVFDEPTAGLDPNQIVQIRSIIRKMGKEKTVIFSTHILSEAEATCDRIVIINRGKVAADGTAETLGASEMRSQVLRLTLTETEMHEVERVFADVAGVQRIAPINEGDQSGVSVRVFCDGDLRSALYDKIRTQKWGLLEFTQERQSLEDTFRVLTQSETPDKEVE